jgi:hypothetical protein
MGNAQWLLECALLLLLAATLFHALRLEKALGVLKRDRAVLEGLVEGFNESTRQAESGIERLRSAADGAGRQMARQTEVAQRLRDDLTFLTDRGDRLAERLESAVRTARMMGDGFSFGSAPAPVPAPPPPALALVPSSVKMVAGFEDGAAAAAGATPVLRSQAERDLIRALRAGR